MADLPSRDELSLFRRRVRDLLRRPPVTCPAGASVARAAGVMTAHHVGSVVVVDGAGAPAGILTVRDLRTRVVAAGRPADVPVAEVMSSPLVSVEADRFAFDALLLMTQRDIHHLGVTDGGRLVGVVGSDDFRAFWLGDPIALARDIEAQPSIEALAGVAPRLTDVVRRLVADGATPGDVGQLVAELNDRLVRRVVALAEARLEAEGLGRPPVAYSWLAAGSEGRREQTFRTDQDSGLVYEDPPPDLGQAAAHYFRRLAAGAGADLARLGFAKCAGGFMAENPQWCQPRSVWQRCFVDWFSEPHPDRLLAAAVFFDLRPVTGDGPGRALWSWVCSEAPTRTLFLRHLARSAVERHPPLGLFGRFVVERSGPRRGTFDIKARGVFPVTQAMRVYALSLGLRATNTLERLAGAAARGAFTEAEAAEVREAYGAILRVRLERQVAALAAGLPPDNFIAPQRLGRIDRLVLREALRRVAWLQRALAERFQTAMVA